MNLWYSICESSSRSSCLVRSASWRFPAVKRKANHKSSVYQNGFHCESEMNHSRQSFRAVGRATAVTLQITTVHCAWKKKIFKKIRNRFNFFYKANQTLECCRIIAIFKIRCSNHLIRSGTKQANTVFWLNLGFRVNFPAFATRFTFSRAWRLLHQISRALHPPAV